MLKIRSTRQLAAAVLATGCFALALGAHAAARPYSMGTLEIKAAGVDAATCKSATLSAWFERQRQLTDGDFVPGPVATPRECVVTPDANAANEPAPARQLVAVAKAPKQGFPGGYEGVVLGGG
jgi:hypothetical protein